MASGVSKVMRRGVLVTWVSVGVNIGLGVMKGLVGVGIGSQALVADGLHHFVDLVTDVATLFGLSVSVKPEDEDHHYGHKKFSSLITLLIGCLLVISCVVVVYDSVKAFFNQKVEEVDLWAIGVAGGSVVVKEVMYWWTKKEAHRARSKLLLVNAWHHRWDSLSTLAVMGSMVMMYIWGKECYFLDSVMGVVLGVYLLYQAVGMGIKASDDLLDRAPEQVIINRLREVVLKVGGVEAYHKFRTRQVGDMYEVDLHLQVDPKITVEEGHEIAARVKHAILKEDEDVVEVLVHLEPATVAHVKDEGLSGGKRG